MVKEVKEVLDLDLDPKNGITTDMSVRDDKVNFDRLTKVVVTSAVGILVNLGLGAMKIFVGLASNSIAIISDAVNNLIDSVSSLVTIITMAIVGKGATRKHPFGFGRIEYFTSMLIACLVLFTGGEFMKNSIEKIIHPEPSTYSTLSLILLFVAILAKIFLGLYTKNRGKAFNSPNLEASGADALSDAILTGVTLVAALVTLFTDLVIDGYVGVLVSLFILKAGIDIIMEVINELLGGRPDEEMAKDIMKDIRNYPGVAGAYDLILHNYGPNVYIGNVNLELDEKISIRDAYKITHPLASEIFNKYGVFFYFGFYSINVTDKDIVEMRDTVTRELMKDPSVLQIHAFYVDLERREINFDAVIDFSVKNHMGKVAELKEKVEALYPGYTVSILPDRDFTLSKEETNVAMEG